MNHIDTRLSNPDLHYDTSMAARGQPGSLYRPMAGYGSGVGNSSRQLLASPTVRVVTFLALHIPLALAMTNITIISTVHALCTLALGVWFLARDNEPYRLIYLTAYITGAEMLWRMTNAQVFWEFGKYAIAALLWLAILKQHRLIRADKRPLLYFVLLLPSCLLSLDRDKLSFNLSGPLALAVATMFFSTVKLTRAHMDRVFVALVAPTLGIAFLALNSTLTAGAIVFSNNSNSITSGDIGPNQVSSVLGLGLLAAVLYAMSSQQGRFLKIVMAGCAIWLGGQCALTFSRGGLWTAFGAIAVAVIYLLRDKRSRLALLATMAVVILSAIYLVFPTLNSFTGGAITDRFSSLSPTGRDLIFEADLIAFSENPLFGVGPGQSAAYHALLYGNDVAHTEYSRLLAEHGSFGLVALLIMVAIVIGRFTRKQEPLEKAYALSFTTVALLFMVHAAMRLVMPAFMFGLGGFTFVSEEQLEASKQNEQNGKKIWYSKGGTATEIAPYSASSSSLAPRK
jgi:O-antigen ligase